MIQKPNKKPRTVIIETKSTNSSYFLKHKSRLHKKQLIQTDYQQLQAQIDLQIKRVQNKNSSDILIEQSANEQQVLHKQFEQLQGKYQQQLKSIKDAIDFIEQQIERQTIKLRIAQKDNNLKKKQLEKLKNHYQNTAKDLKEKQYDNTDKVNQMKNKLNQVQRSHNEEIKKLDQEYKVLVQQNQELNTQLEVLNEELEQQQKIIGSKDYDTKMEELQIQEVKIQNQIKNLQEQSTKLRSDIQKISNIKPVNSSVHQRFLELYEKIVISREIAKAEEILAIKEEERKQLKAIQDKKLWIQEKTLQISVRQARIAEKNATIEELSSQIRQKSTTLLNLYIEQQPQTPKRQQSRIYQSK